MINKKILMGSGEALAPDNWVMEITNSSTSGYISNRVISATGTIKYDDTNDKIIFTCDYNDDTDDVVYLASFDVDGTVNWEKSINGDANSSDKSCSICLDSSSNIYLSTQSTYPSAYQNAVYKYNSSGVRQWSNYHPLDESSDYNGTHLQIIAGDLYHLTVNTTSETMKVEKLSDTSGAISEYAELQSTSKAIISTCGIAYDGSNLFIGMHVTNGAPNMGNPYGPLIAKYNTSLTYSTYTALEDGYEYGGDLLYYDSYLYLNSDQNIRKYSTSLTLIEDKRISGAQSGNQPTMCSDGAGYFYVAIPSNSGLVSVMKLTTDLDVVWGRELYLGNVGAVGLKGVTVGGGYVYLVALDHTNDDAIWIAKLSTKGSGIGSYGATITYSADTITTIANTSDSFTVSLSATKPTDPSETSFTPSEGTPSDISRNVETL